MQRFVSILLAALLLLPIDASARNASEYKDISLMALTNFAVHYNTYDLKDDTTFTDYLRVVDCRLYTESLNNPFQIQSIKEAAIKKISSVQNTDMALHFNIPVTFIVSGYDFETQSLSILPSSQWQKVNMLELTNSRDGGCRNNNANAISKISGMFQAQLNFPVSLYRIPLQKNVAENITQKLEFTDFNKKNRKLYGSILFSVDPIQPEISMKTSIMKAIVRGQIDAIDLFIDPEHKIFFKRLDYAEIF